MPTFDVFRSRAFRLALAFCLAVAAATALAFGFIYLQVSSVDMQRVGAILVDEAAKSAGDSEAELRQALALRLTRDIRRLDYVALFESKGDKVFGNVPAMPAIPVDGQAHLVRDQLLPDSSSREPALFVALRRADGGVLVLGRSLRDVYELQGTVLKALATALAPTIVAILAIGALFARRASRRLDRVSGAIVRIMNGELDSRLPVANERDDIDKIARAVNLMLDEIARLLDQLKSVGDNIAHDLRTPLMVAQTKLERALEEESGTEPMRRAMRATLAQIDKASATISAVLRISAVENGAREQRFKDIDLSLICGEVFEFYEPLAESKSVQIELDAGRPVVIRGDEDMMREAVSNLVDNAIKFTPAGGQVRIEARLVDGLPRVVVSDSGCGVPLHERTKIFKRFYRVDRSEGAQGGHGIGLSIAETIANIHGFRLNLEDNNPGSRFVLSPAAKASLALERKAA